MFARGNNENFVIIDRAKLRKSMQAILSKLKISV